MKIAAYAIMWNEELRLKWYLDHYSQFVDEIHLYDNYSSDKTLEIAHANSRVTVESFGTPGVLNNGDFLAVKNNCWKGSNADWVVVGDIDELLYHPDWPALLNNTGATVLFPSVAYNMLSEADITDYKQLRTGFFSPGYIKGFMFRPAQLTEIGYHPGGHMCEPKGNAIIEHPAHLVMYHYGHPGFEWTCNRYAVQAERRSYADKKHGWAIHYTQSRERVREYFDKAKGCAEVTPW